MEAIILTAGLLVLIVIGFVVFVLPLIRRGAPAEGHDDQLRAGSDAGTDVGAATDRATGATAWMRPGGGGF